MKYIYTIVSSDKESIMDGAETDNFDSAELIARAIESTGATVKINIRVAA